MFERKSRGNIGMPIYDAPFVETRDEGEATDLPHKIIRLGHTGSSLRTTHDAGD